MLPFMMRRGEPGPYMAAFEHSLATFTAKDPGEMAHRGGGRYDPGEETIVLTSLNQELEVSFPDGEVTFRGTGLRPRWGWELVVLNYLGRADGTHLSGDLISFRELEGGRAFHQAFTRYTISRLAELAVEDDFEIVRRACSKLGGDFIEIGDVGARVPFLPRFPVTVILWAGDEEINSSANILFDRTANHYLHTEDVSAAGGLVVSALAGFIEQGPG